MAPVRVSEATSRHCSVGNTYQRTSQSSQFERSKTNISGIPNANSKFFYEFNIM